MKVWVRARLTKVAHRVLRECRTNMTCLALAMVCLPVAAATSSSAEIRIPVVHLFRGVPLEFHKALPPLGSGARVNLSRLEYLISDIKLRAEDGTSCSLDGQYFHINPLEGSSELVLHDVPARNWREMTFQVGIESAINHADPARWPAGHALNVLECNLHWSWQGGYVFMAIEGTAKGTPGTTESKTFLYHIGNDANLMRASALLPGDGKFAELELVFNVDKLWDGKTKVAPLDDGGLTHSSAGDTLAPSLARNVEQAFEVRPRAK